MLLMCNVISPDVVKRDCDVAFLNRKHSFFVPETFLQDTGFHSTEFYVSDLTRKYQHKDFQTKFMCVHAMTLCFLRYC